jgi:hypothetical protein
MAEKEPVCACGRPAVDVLRIAGEDGLLLVPVCEECGDSATGAAEEQLDLFGRIERRPLAAMPSRDDDRQRPLPLDERLDIDEKHDAA